MSRDGCIGAAVCGSTAVMYVCRRCVAYDGRILYPSGGVAPAGEREGLGIRL